MEVDLLLFIFWLRMSADGNSREHPVALRMPGVDCVEKIVSFHYALVLLMSVLCLQFTFSSLCLYCVYNLPLAAVTQAASDHLFLIPFELQSFVCYVTVVLRYWCIKLHIWQFPNPNPKHLPVHAIQCDIILFHDACTALL